MNRKRNNGKSYNVERSNSELIEICIDREYQDMLAIYHEVVNIIGKAKNDVTYLEVLDELAGNKEEAITSLACWLSDQRCSEWSNTVHRLYESIKAAVRTYVKETDLNN